MQSETHPSNGELSETEFEVDADEIHSDSVGLTRFTTSAVSTGHCLLLSTRKSRALCILSCMLVCCTPAVRSMAITNYSIGPEWALIVLRQVILDT